MKCVEILPATTTDPHRGTTWEPGARPGCGVLTIDVKRSRTLYDVCEVAAPTGRAFVLAKVGGDPAAGGYPVSAGGVPPVRCGCPGFAYRSACKHADAVLALLENGWV